MSKRLVWIALAVCTLASISTIVTTGAIAVDTPSGSIVSDGFGELTIAVVDGDTGSALAARARIVPSKLWKDERVLVERHGRFVAKLAPGAYRVTLTHGPEWSPYERTVEVRADARTHLSARLFRGVDASAYTACDLHVHTDESPDSNLDLAARVGTLLAEDVQFAVLTDHNRVTDARAALAAVGIASLPGVEVTTWDPELGHFNVFPRAAAPKYRHASATRLMRELRKQPDSFVQMNHPRLEGHIGYFELAQFERDKGAGTRDFPMEFDGIEVWNGYDLAAEGRRHEVFVDWLAMIARGQHITATGNSDSHKAGLAPYVGYPRTYVHVPRAEAHTPGKVLHALKHGRAFVTNGPIVNLTVRGKQPGDTLHLARGELRVTAQVEVSAPAWMELSEVELWLGRERVAVMPLDTVMHGHAHEARVERELDVRDERSLVATVRGRASMKPLIGRASVAPYAFTNPVWIVRP